MIEYEYAKIIVPGLIALLGTLITVLVALFQWRKKESRRSHYDAERVDAYKTLWDKMETVHVGARKSVRESGPSPDELFSIIQDMNTFILKSSLYLDEEDHALANQYVAAVRRLCNAIADTDDEQLEMDCAITAEIPPAVIEVAQEQAEVYRLRTRLIEKYSTIISRD